MPGQKGPTLGPGMTKYMLCHLLAAPTGTSFPLP
jgi:hypothetical protein